MDTRKVLVNCTRCRHMKNLNEFQKDNGKLYKLCEECRIECRDYVNSKRRVESYKQEKEIFALEIKQRLDELIPLINELREML